MNIARSAKAIAYGALVGATLPRAQAIYVGSGESTNMGDRALFLAHQILLPDLRWAVVDRLSTTKLIERILSLSGAKPLVVLGGGTLIGDPVVRRLIEAIVAGADVSPICLGTGVDAARGDLAKWVPVLRRFSFVGVRGPRSRNALLAAGIDAHEVADPALIFGDAGARPHGGVTVNVGWGSSRLGGEYERYVSAMRGAIQIWSKAGVSVDLVSVWPKDDACTREIAAGNPVRRVVLSADGMHHQIRALGSSDVAVCIKLHAGILSLCQSVPTVLLSYRDKIDDFSDSFGVGCRTLRLDAVTAEAVVDVAAAQAEAPRSQIASRLSVMRARLADAVDQAFAAKAASFRGVP